MAFKSGDWAGNFSTFGQLAATNLESYAVLWIILQNELGVLNPKFFYTGP